MDVHQLRVFLAVYRNRSFSKASEELRLSQPTVSDHIKSLENGFGVRLFDRLGRTIIPTEAAALLSGLAEDIVARVDALPGALTSIGEDVTGNLVVGASTIPGTYVLPPVMVGFKQRHPAVSFRIISGDSKQIVEQIARHDLILGFVGSKGFSRDLRYSPFIDDELVIVRSPSLEGKGRISLRELRGYPLLFREEGSGTQREFELFLQRHGATIDEYHMAGAFGSTDAIKQAVMSGGGVAVLSRLAVEEELKSGRLKAITLAEGTMRRKFYVVTHRKRTLPAVYSLFLEYLKEYLKKVH